MCMLTQDPYLCLGSRLPGILQGEWTVMFMEQVDGAGISFVGLCISVEVKSNRKAACPLSLTYPLGDFNSQ
jgi:hypothetical protein